MVVRVRVDLNPIARVRAHRREQRLEDRAHPELLVLAHQLVRRERRAARERWRATRTAPPSGSVAVAVVVVVVIVRVGIRVGVRVGGVGVGVGVGVGGERRAARRRCTKLLLQVG